MRIETKIQKFINKLNTINRVYIVAGFFILFGLFIITKIFQYTVFDKEFYTKLADRQQIWEDTVPVTRWTIYSDTKEGTILWTSLNLYDIAIDPHVDMGWSKVKLENFLTEVVYKETCENVNDTECYENMLKFLRELEIQDFQLNETYIKTKISEFLRKKINQENITSVFIDKQLEQEEINAISSLRLPGIYPNFPYVYANPEEITDLSFVVNQLAPIMNIKEENLQRLLRKRKVRYVPIMNKLSIWTSEFVKQYLEEESIAYKRWLITLEERAGNFVILTPRPHRYYPEKDIASQVTGFVDSEGKWHYWLEGFFDEYLQWNSGKIVSRKDVLWRTINPIDLDENNGETQWVEIHTTIDRNIQKRVEEILEAWVKKYKANKWTVVIMEPTTGRIISMANYPTFDLNNFSDVYELEKVRYSKYPNPSFDLMGYPVFVEDTEDGQKYFYDNKEIFLRSATEEELWDPVVVKYKYKNGFWPAVYKNDAISSLYEPGSIMKSIIFAIGLDTWEFWPNELYRDNNELSIGPFSIRNVDKKNCGWLKSFSNALDYSCNVWFVRMVQQLWKLVVYNYFEKFGFDKKTWVTLEWEVVGKLQYLSDLSDTQFYTNSYGLGMSVTPLQMAASYSVLANWGVYYTPRVIDSIEFSNGKTITYKTEIQRRVLKESTSKMMVKLLVNWIANWAAKKAYIEWYNLAGKTGTAQIAEKWWYCSTDCLGKTNASFAGFWPAEDPKFVIVVKLERPRTSEYWGSTSSYIFKDIAEYLLDVYKIPKK